MKTPEDIQAAIDDGNVPTLPVKKLKPWKKNPRKMVKEAAWKLVNTLQMVGWGAPLLVQEGTLRVIGGHTRLTAAKMIGLERLPVSVLEISDRDADAMSLADNRMGEFASWDDAGLASILSDFSLEEVEALGWDELDLEKLADTVEDFGPLETDSDEAPEYCEACGKKVTRKKDS